MGKESRYIVWREQTRTPNEVSVRDLLSSFPTVKILKFKDPDYAVVLMDPKTERKIQQHLPELSIEEDVQHRLICSR